jgi:hypothetical protein
VCRLSVSAVLNLTRCSYPVPATWDIPASKDCQRITPEPTDGSAVEYKQDDDMLDPRTMGQFIILPTGKLLMINGGANGTAGYSNVTNTTDYNPYGFSLAAAPVLTPALYDPSAPAGQRWSNAGFGASTIPRLYHSSALLLPNGAVMIAGSYVLPFFLVFLPSERRKSAATRTWTST